MEYFIIILYLSFWICFIALIENHIKIKNMKKDIENMKIELLEIKRKNWNNNINKEK